MKERPKRAMKPLQSGFSALLRGAEYLNRILWLSLVPVVVAIFASSVLEVVPTWYWYTRVWFEIMFLFILITLVARALMYWKRSKRLRISYAPAIITVSQALLRHFLTLAALGFVIVRHESVFLKWYLSDPLPHSSWVILPLVLAYIFPSFIIPTVLAFLLLIVLIMVLASGQWLLKIFSTHTGAPFYGFEDSGLEKVYPEGIILISLAVFTIWIAIWRGIQARQQIQEAQRQIRDQAFNHAIDMATDVKNPARVRTGFTRLSQLHEENKGEGGEGRQQEADQYLRAAQNAAKIMLEGKGKEDDKIVALARYGALKFLLKYPRREWASAVWESETGKKKRGEWQLSNFDLSGLNLGELLSEAIEEDATKKGWRVVARGSDCTGMFAMELHPSRVNLSNADLHGAILTDASFTGAVMTNANLTDARMPDPDLNETEINLTEADLTGADLTGADLIGAQLGGANLTDADLAHADLTNAWLVSSSMRRVKFGRESRSLHQIDLRGIEPKVVVFKRTRIDRADFRQVCISLGDAEKEKRLLESLLRGCCWDKTNPSNAPKLPYGIKPDSLANCPRNKDEEGAGDE